MTPWQQQVYLASRIWFLNTIFLLKTRGLLWNMVNARAGAEKTQDKPGTFIVPNVRKCLKNNGDMSKVHKRWASSKGLLLAKLRYNWKGPTEIHHKTCYKYLSPGLKTLPICRILCVPTRTGPHPICPLKLLVIPLQTALGGKCQEGGYPPQQIVHPPQAIRTIPSYLPCLFSYQHTKPQNSQVIPNPTSTWHRICSKM